MTISEDSPDYKKRFIILPEGVATQLYNWHGGQWSGVYSLASTGDHDLVSPAMVQRALSELEEDASKAKNKSYLSKKDKKELSNLIGELDMVLSSPYEFSAKEAGMDIEEDDYEYSPNPSCSNCDPAANPLGISAGWVIGGLAAAAGLIWLVTRSKTADAATNPPLPPAPPPVNTPAEPGQCFPDAASLNVWGATNGIQIVIVTDQQGHTQIVGDQSLHAPRLYWQQADGDTFLRTQDRHMDLLGTKSYCDYLATQRATLHGVDPTAMFLL